MPGACSIAVVTLSTVLCVSVSWGLVGVLSELHGLIPCQGQHVCFYMKGSPDGVLPRGFGHLSTDRSRMDPDLLRILEKNGISPICANATAAEMQERCSGVRPVNTLVGGGLLFRVALMVWGVVRVIHDIAVLQGKSLRATERLGFLEFVLLSIAALSAVDWSLGALEPFKGDLGEGHRCGCFYELGMVPSLAAMAVPGGLLAHTWARSRDMCLELLNGPYLLACKHHVPVALVQDSGLDPTGTLLLSRGMPGRAATGNQPTQPETRSSGFQVLLFIRIAIWLLWISYLDVACYSAQRLTFKFAQFVPALVSGLTGFEWDMGALSKLVVRVCEVIWAFVLTASVTPVFLSELVRMGFSLQEAVKMSAWRTGLVILGLYMATGILGGIRLSWDKSEQYTQVFACSLISALCIAVLAEAPFDAAAPGLRQWPQIFWWGVLQLFPPLQFLLIMASPDERTANMRTAVEGLSSRMFVEELLRERLPQDVWEVDSNRLRRILHAQNAGFGDLSAPLIG